MANLDNDGTLHLYIAAGKNTPKGGQMFDEAIEAFGAENIQAIKGSWNGGGDLASNFDAYKAAVARGVPPKQAALDHTFTGHMAKKYGFTLVDIQRDNARLVEPLFTRPR